MNHRGLHGTTRLHVDRLCHTPEADTRPAHNGLDRRCVLPASSEKDGKVRVIDLLELDEVLEECVCRHVRQCRRCHTWSSTSGAPSQPGIPSPKHRETPTDNSVVELILELAVKRSGHAERLVVDCEPGKLHSVPDHHSRSRSQTVRIGEQVRCGLISGRGTRVELVMPLIPAVSESTTHPWVLLAPSLTHRIIRLAAGNPKIC